MNEMPAPIIITGAARSGTSMIAGAINICGAFGGEMSGPNKNNAKGMFENAAIRNQVVKPYLNDIGVDRLGQYPLPDIEKLLVPLDWKSRVGGIMKDQGYAGGPWMYKGAKCCLMWPIWHIAFPNAKWIIVRRRTGDIISSCMRTGFMRAFVRQAHQRAVGAKDEREGWLWWVRQHEKRFVEMINAGVNCKVVWAERTVTGDYTQLYDALEWLGLKWKEEVVHFIDPKLWKSRGNADGKSYAD